MFVRDIHLLRNWIWNF